MDSCTRCSEMAKNCPRHCWWTGPSRSLPACTTCTPTRLYIGIWSHQSEWISGRTLPKMCLLSWAGLSNPVTVSTGACAFMPALDVLWTAKKKLLYQFPVYSLPRTTLWRYQTLAPARSGMRRAPRCHLRAPWRGWRLKSFATNPAPRRSTSGRLKSMSKIGCLC